MNNLWIQNHSQQIKKGQVLQLRSFGAIVSVLWFHRFPTSTLVQWALRPFYPPLSPFLHHSLLPQSSNELKGQSTNKTISRNESLRCVNALLIPVSKFHPPAVCCPLMRNKTPRSREGGWGNGSMLRLLHSRLHTHGTNCAHTHTSHTH